MTIRRNKRLYSVYVLVPSIKYKNRNGDWREKNGIVPRAKTYPYILGRIRPVYPWGVGGGGYLLRSGCVGGGSTIVIFGAGTKVENNPYI